MEGRESEEMSRAARRMAEAAEEISRSVSRLAEQQAATEQIYRYWEEFDRALREGGTFGAWRIVPGRPEVSEEDATVLALEAVREVREELWAAREPEARAPDAEDVERWANRRDNRRVQEEGFDPF